MSDWNAERALHKAKKLGQIDVKSVSGGKRKPRPWKVVAKSSIPGVTKEYTAYQGADEEACRRWIEKQARSWWLTRQDQSPRAISEAQKRAELLAARYRIVPPKEHAC